MKELESLLAAGDVTVNSGGSMSSNILVSSGIGWSSNSALTLDAYKSVTINKSIAVSGDVL